MKWYSYLTNYELWIMGYEFADKPPMHLQIILTSIWLLLNMLFFFYKSYFERISFKTIDLNANDCSFNS